jgi:gluconolactonase
MRTFFTAFAWCSVSLVLGCSSDPSTDPAVGTLAPRAGSSGTESSASAAPGAGGTSPVTPPPPAIAGGNPGTSSPGPEGITVVGLDDPGANKGGAEPSGAGARADAGTTSPARSSCPAGPFPASPLPAGAAPQPICTGMTFTEGAVWFDDLDTLFFSDFQLRDAASNFNGRILSYSPNGQCQTFIENAGTNGLVIGLDGNLLGARHREQNLTSFNLMTKEATVLVPDFNGASFNSPNDIAVRSDGNLYFTDPNYMLGNRASELPMQSYRRDPSGALSVIDTGASPNGITLSPDESRLYLSHLGNPNNVLVFDVDASGAVGNPRPFLANVGSDGMAIDCAGNLYVTTQGSVRVFDPSGAPLGTLAAPGAANVAFGGPDHKTLYITATTMLLAVELEIPGLPY